MPVRHVLCQTLLAALLAGAPALAAPRADANGDGKLDLPEFQALMQKRLLKADANGDGKISLDEWKAHGVKSKRDPAKTFSRLDTNGDGFLDASEIAALADRRFRRFDADKDGFVTVEEHRAHKAAAKG